MYTQHDGFGYNHIKFVHKGAIHIYRTIAIVHKRETDLCHKQIHVISLN